MKKLPIGIQSISKVLLGGKYLYVDKTLFAKKLLDEGAQYYFMSRPRRFGKSLFLDTLREILKGNKDLFKGQKIYESDYEWKKYPIVYLDFSTIGNSTPERLEAALKVRLEIIAKEYGVSIITQDVQVALETLVTQLSNKYKSEVAILIDEYDKPIIDRLEDLIVAKKNRDILKGFFGTLKGVDSKLRFVFVTGISKFSQVSLFSALNNLKDITMDPKYAKMLGYTEEELKETFEEYIESISKKRNTSSRHIIQEIRSWYNGYRFSEEELSVYNPYSTLLFFDGEKPKSYWYRTGTPSFLIDQIKKHPHSIISLSQAAAREETLSDISKVDKIHLAALMFQTGYLTIQGYNPEENSYTLDFPNREVKEAFLTSLLQEFVEVDPLEMTRAAKKISSDLKKLDLISFIDRINAHFAKMPYHIFQHAKEGFYQAVFFTFLEIAGIKTSSEIATNIGRIDLITETPDVICIFELKLDQTAEIALSQAETKKYRKRCSDGDKNTLVLGINFSSTSRNISDWKGLLYSPTGKLKQGILPKNRKDMQKVEAQSLEPTLNASTTPS